MAVLILSGYGFIQENGLDKIIKKGDQVERLAEGFLFTEGPSADAKGNVYFTDQPNDRIMEWSTDGRLSTFMQPCGRSNGLAFDKKGNLWACADENNELWCITPGKKITKIPSGYNNKPLNGPNDLWVAPDGGIYFTDPYYKRTWWDHDTMPQSCQAVFYLEPDHMKIIRVIEDLVQPNGIAGTPDGKHLLVADIGANKTFSYEIEKDGSLSEKKLICEMGSDGMTVDIQGNIYLTGKGVTIFDRNGKYIGNIPVPESWTANVCFGGIGRKSLFITASRGLYRIKTLVQGVE